MEEDVKGLGDYLDIVWRRKYWVLIPAVILTVVAVGVVMWLPATYKSSGTILIESQEIPTSLIQSTVTSYADQRIEIIKQRLMTTQRVMEIVNKYNLYREARKNSPSTAGIVSLFRENVSIELVQANVTDPTSGRAKRASIAFTVSFTDKSPRAAQSIASELVTQFLDENVKTRTDRAEETKSFLQEEADKLQKKVQEIEKQIAEFKDQYSDSLPELLQYNLSMIERLQEELATNQSEIMTIKDQIATMSLGLSSTDAYLPQGQTVSTTDGKRSNTEALLQQLRAEYNAVTAKYQSTHPDVVRLKKQITALEKELGIDSFGTAAIQQQIESAEAELSKLKERYADNHPDVKALNNKIENLKAELLVAESASDDSSENTKTAERVANPAYLQLKLRIDSGEREVSRLRARQDEIKVSLADYQKRVSQTNQVSRAYLELTRDHDNTLAKYKDLRAKQLQAELAQNLESENKGENFTLIEPPQLPSEPEKPNRPKLIAMGVVASGGAGVGLALIIEFLFGGIRGYNQISQVVGKAPLVVVPMIVTASEVAKKKKIRNLWIVTAVVAFIAALVAVHFFVMNLEVLWFKAMRKIGQL